MAKEYKSMRGKKIDIDLLRKKNELTPAVGNARVNARGDELGPGGKIVRKREEIVTDHYGSKSVRQTSGRGKNISDVETNDVVEVEEIKTKRSTSKTKKEKVEVELTQEEKELFEEAAQEDEWIEDDSGNFVKKGE